MKGMDLLVVMLEVGRLMQMRQRLQRTMAKLQMVVVVVVVLVAELRLGVPANNAAAPAVWSAPVGSSNCWWWWWWWC